MDILVYNPTTHIIYLYVDGYLHWKKTLKDVICWYCSILYYHMVPRKPLACGFIWSFVLLAYPWTTYYNDTSNVWKIYTRRKQKTISKWLRCRSRILCIISPLKFFACYAYHSRRKKSKNETILRKNILHKELNFWSYKVQKTSFF